MIETCKKSDSLASFNQKESGSIFAAATIVGQVASLPSEIVPKLEVAIIALAGASAHCCLPIVRVASSIICVGSRHSGTMLKYSITRLLHLTFRTYFLS